jgi:hypothetical protein
MWPVFYAVAQLLCGNSSDPKPEFGMPAFFGRLPIDRAGRTKMCFAPRKIMIESIAEERRITIHRREFQVNIPDEVSSRGIQRR